MTPPTLVYLGMGLVVARIMLDGRQTRGLTWLQWLQYLVDAARITLLWPLVLLVEKVSTWLRAGPDGLLVPSPAASLLPSESAVLPVKEGREGEVKGGNNP
jgi:hypothetical protein